MRWDTTKPQASVLYIDPREARLYYPEQKALEIYPLDSRLGELAASPLPRLSALRERFSFEQVPVTELSSSADPTTFVALKLTPIEESLRKYVSQVRVLLDAPHAHIVVAEVTDGDGDRTVLTFRDVQTNPDVGDLELHVPPGTRVSHPLEGLDRQGPPPRGKSK
jgi:outer membrane lipoprotein-sorting protein